MSFDRVIQDSDDEEDLEPVGEVFPERTNRVPETNEVQQSGTGFEVREVNGTSPIGVNFDDFLGSPQASRTLSASQQQREERWIPSTARPGSSAKERLFDDDQQQQAQYAHQQAYFHETEPEPEKHLDNDVALTETAPDVQLLPPAPAEDSIAQPEVHVTNPSDDWSQTQSYNIFDSSLHTPSNPFNRADFMHDSDATAPTEPMQNFESRRWNYLQMQGEISSPHDTEPFSSIISPKVVRAEVENATQNIPQSSSASIDELALPVTAEVPKMEKRGRPKKQPVPVIDEDDELSAPHPHEPLPTKPEKRKPGRPKKAANVVQNDEVNGGRENNAESSGAPADGYQKVIGAGAPEFLSSTGGENGAPEYSAEAPGGEDQGRHLTVPVADQGLQVPPKATKEPKKKKLKRNKGHDSEAEDDLILLDQKPISKPEETTQDAAVERPPAPKKRGRKKKKKTEEVQPEIAELPAEDQQVAQHAIPDEDNTLNDSSISVVLENKKATDRAQTPNIENSTTEHDATQDPIYQNSPSPSKPLEPSPVEQTPETPQKHTNPKTPSSKGPGKHSPISSTSKVPYRVGLSKKARIAPLLKIIKR